MPAGTRPERDSLGQIPVPKDAYYGVQTERARRNFPISGQGLPRTLIESLGQIKAVAAVTNGELGLIPAKLAKAIERASREVQEGKWDEHFVVDIFQTGSGTSSNMNANEVIANRANEILGKPRGAYAPVHPNDHVNTCQSSNDIMPTALHLAALYAHHRDLFPSLEQLHGSLSAKAKEFRNVVKVGRTHFQDATPVRLGQEFSGYARMIELGSSRIRRASDSLLEVVLGGTATGTGINAHPRFATRAIARLAEESGFRLRPARDRFESMGAKDAALEVSGALRGLAVSLTKIAGDLRFLSCGPRAGIAELRLPSLQPGSSIMPGKVNPVIPEVVLQVAAQVQGNDLAVSLGAAGGHCELNLALPIIARNLLESIRILSTTAVVFAEKCIDGIEADTERITHNVERNTALATALNPWIGYEAAAAIAKEAYASGRTVLQVAKERTDLTEAQLRRILDSRKLTKPGIPGN
jgi:fumarate hydratase class II